MIPVFDGPNLPHLAIVKAHEDFVDDLKSSGINYAVVRPTGYFSDMTEFLKMAQKGRIYLIGKGTNKCNPIHGADLAQVCADAVTGGDAEVPAGGPIIYSQNEIAELAFSILDRPPKITRIPTWMTSAAIKSMRLFNRHAADLFDFFATAAQYENVAPQLGTHTLDDYYREMK